VITNESSTQQTPLPTETPGLPEQPENNTFEPLAPAPTIGRWHDWFNLAKGFLLWVASIILLVAVQLVFVIPYMIYRWVSDGRVDVVALQTDKIAAFLQIIAVAPTHLLTLGLIWLLVTEGRQRPFWKTVGFEWPANFRPTVVLLACTWLAIVLLALGGLLTWKWGGNKTQLDLLVESSVGARWATAFVATFTAPLVEELIYRGVLYSAIERTLGTIIAILVVTLLFAGVHVFQYKDNIAVIAVITLLSITLTLVRAYTGKVLPSFIIHFVFNGLQSILIALSPFINWSGSN
jgi:membrane protease YdiL (CAAX protease family)